MDWLCIRVFSFPAFALGMLTLHAGVLHCCYRGSRFAYAPALLRFVVYVLQLHDVVVSICLLLGMLRFGFAVSPLAMFYVEYLDYG